MNPEILAALRDLAFLRDLLEQLPNEFSIDDVNTGINATLRDHAIELADRHVAILALISAT